MRKAVKVSIKKHLLMNEHKYILEPSGNGRKYHTCPHCGAEKFTLYIDVDTGLPLADYVGRCERINSCRYHYPPREYFKNLTIKNKKIMTEKQALKETTSVVKEERVNRRYSKIVDYVKNALFCFLVTIFGKQKVLAAFQKYDVRTSMLFRKDNKYGAVFIMKAKDGLIRQVKEMAYDPNTGKRVKEEQSVFKYDYKTNSYQTDNDGLRILYTGKSLMKDYDFENKLCFFGEHLLAGEVSKPIAIVESEKTAIICDICMPDYIWLATGGKNGCKWTTDEVYQVLKDANQPIILFPDLNATEDWTEKAEILLAAGLDVSIYDLEEQEGITEEDKAKGLDIGDYLIRFWKENHPEDGETLEEIKCKKANIPQLSKMFSSLSPKKELGTIEELGITIDPNEVDSLLPKKPSASVSDVDLDVISDIE